jgi:hypothetical protein
MLLPRQRPRSRGMRNVGLRQEDTVSARTPEPPNADTPTLETVLAQFYVAFGQGAGSLFVDPDAIVAGRTEFEANIWPKIRSWEAAALPALEYIRSVGRISAHLAIGEGRNVISAGHFRDALRMFAETACPPFGMCPCLDRVRKTPPGR